MILGITPSPEQIIDIGLNHLVQCFKLDVKSGEITTKLSLNVLGVIYSVDVPTHELSEPGNIADAWKQLISDFGVFHMMGQSKRVQDGHREATEDELKMLEDNK